MRVQTLDLTNFRNYRRLRLRLPAGRLVLIGGNGQGKTNLVDAIHILASGRSLRPGPEAAWVRFDAPASEGFARMRAELAGTEGPAEVEMIVARARPEAGEASGVRRRVRIGGAPRRLADLPGRLLAIGFAPADLGVWTGPPAGRRRWLDLAVAQLDRAYTAALETYEAVLTRRNALLRRLQGGVGRPSELGFWDEKLTEPALAITAARADYLARAQAPLRAGFQAMQGGARFDLDYCPAAAQPTAAALLAALRQRRDRDVQRGASGLGPHRDDLAPLIDGRPLAHVGSRGQLRMAALALKLGQYQLALEALGERAVLLLDDVAAELDAQRRRLLIDQLPPQAQTIVTAADASLLDDSALAAAPRFHVADGRIEPADA